MILDAQIFVRSFVIASIAVTGFNSPYLMFGYIVACAFMCAVVEVLVFDRKD